jgi:hypothetical protein
MPPKSVLAAALEAIAAQWPEAKSGWTLSQSRVQISRTGGDFTFAISLQSSFYNRGGHEVTCSPYWRVQSKRWKTWVRKQPWWQKGPYSSPGLNDYVRRLDSKGPGLGLQTWIFPASGPDRNSLETALSDLSCNVSPIFQAMPCPEALATLVAQTYALQVKPIMWCEYFIAIDRFDLAQQVLRATMDMSPQMASSFASFADVSQQGQKLPGSIHKIYYEHACKLGLFTLS